MKEDDFFNFILFDSEISVWKETLIKATPENLDEARKFVQHISAQGSKYLTGLAYTSLCKLIYWLILWTQCYSLLGFQITDKALLKFNFTQNMTSISLYVSRVQVLFYLDIPLLVNTNLSFSYCNEISSDPSEKWTFILTAFAEPKFLCLPHSDKFTWWFDERNWYSECCSWGKPCAQEKCFYNYHVNRWPAKRR